MSRETSETYIGLVQQTQRGPSAALFIRGRQGGGNGHLHSAEGQSFDLDDR